MQAATTLLLLLGVAAGVAGLAGRWGVSAPVLLTAVGLVGSTLPWVPSYRLQPDVVLLGLLPPLLYSTAIRTPWVDITRKRRPIALLSVALVLVTALVTGLVAQLLLPGLPFAAAVALGAVVAPPDAVAASAVARRVRMPRTVVSLLEGESLLNDATALVTLRTAVAALAGSVSLLQAGGDFVLAAGVGVAAGVVVAFLLGRLRRRVTDPVLDVSLSLLAPYVAYLAAERLHGSGVIAVVITGLALGNRSMDIQDAAGRVTERTIWRTLQFILESAVFLLIGLQLRGLVTDAVASDVSNRRILAVCLGVLGTVIVVRVLWVFPAMLVPAWLRSRHDAGPPVQPSHVALVAWAGMRGVVTLAAAFSLPASTPHREVLVIAAFAVVMGTLLIQGPSLPLAVRLLRVQGPDPAQDALASAVVMERAARAGLDRLDEVTADADADSTVAELRAWGTRLANAAWERLGANDGRNETPSQAFRRLRLQMLDAERRVVFEARASGEVSAEVLEHLLDRLDLEEAMLIGFAESAPDAEEGSLTSIELGRCEHLLHAPERPVPAPPLACAGCRALGVTDWVHLRMCLTCGELACCDSSPNRHATGHFEQTGHPVMRSAEPGEAWRWCYLDEVTA